jgi:hypothetical protein
MSRLLSATYPWSYQNAVVTSQWLLVAALEMEPPRTYMYGLLVN